VRACPDHVSPSIRSVEFTVGVVGSRQSAPLTSISGHFGPDVNYVGASNVTCSAG